MPKKFWDEARIARLTKMVADGQSFLDIARYLDCSRSAVARACHRLGIKSLAPQAKPQPRRPKQPIRQEDKALPRNQPAPDPAPLTEDEKMRDFFGGSFMGYPPATLPQHESPPADPVPDDAAPAEGILLADLQPMDCRWPLNDGGPYRFCGCRKLSLKGPYCEAHEKRAGGGQLKLKWNAKAKSGLSMRNAVGRI